MAARSFGPSRSSWRSACSPAPSPRSSSPRRCSSGSSSAGRGPTHEASRRAPREPAPPRFRRPSDPVLVDTHCHLGDVAFAGDRTEVVERALAAGVAHLVVVGESRASTALGLTMAEADTRISTTAGLHPHDARTWTDETAAWLAETLQDPRVVACGEIGLDYHYDHSPRDTQRLVFERQMALAEAAGKPVVIHAREADADVAAVLQAFPAVTAILHSFSSGPALFDAGVALGHYVSFSGMVTFRSWALDALVRATPPERLLVETDAPYLAPVPHRGHRNEPAYVRLVAERVATVRGEDAPSLMDRTGQNAQRVFGDRVGSV
ncbi:MAG: TatD family deoxyribonuclease [Gemmatimonadales bacterium]|nr:MAG: TatD family deoxyribonuclease [Gemmatimonadales bacterium]